MTEKEIEMRSRLHVTSFNHEITQLDDDWGLVKYVQSVKLPTTTVTEWWYIYHVPCVARCVQEYPLVTDPETCGKCRDVVPVIYQGLVVMCRWKTGDQSC